MKRLCDRLHLAMQKTGISSQTELALRSGVNQSIISKILAGKNETSKYSGKLAAALGISADWLINGTGNMDGGDTTLQKVDFSTLVPVWNESGQTDDSFSWSERVPEHYRAYLLRKNSGISNISAGSVVLVDPNSTPGTNDLVLSVIKNEVSIYRYITGGLNHGFLAVDDERVPLLEITDPEWVKGVVEQVLIRKFR
ncbi:MULTISPECIES: helix-turn-helix domain-containing protein [Pectobacterium]|uniref:helix-turn-helix domain-containing protein n=1 Tax=Pectobacterium TaxID=122277 RepID=UPI0019697892|nr:helix-turn-helix domain-containing protein [Pectobacterium brasiliense]MBN3057956.1 helix-turn-helix domain-containing protein [Pectobacterium brasiliense]